MTASMRKLPNLKNATWLNEPRLQRVMAVLNAAGEVRVAGGAVRNALMRLPIADVDLATTLLPADVMQLAKQAGFNAHPTGIEHGTVTVVNHAVAFEVTTLRRDIETDGRHATVVFTRHFAEDAARRDFTMNAMYCSSRGEITDYTDGYNDILKNRIKFVGDAKQRIAEDYLRILRFFRFYAAYGKGAPDASGLAACKKLKPGLQQLSAERVRQEMFKLLAAPRAVDALKVMAAAGILKLILPYTEDWRVLKRLPTDPVLRLFVLAKDVGSLKERLRLSNEEHARLGGLAAAPALSPKLREKERRAMLYALGPNTWRDAVVMAWAKARVALDDRAWGNLLKLGERWSIPQLPISGKDLLAQGMQPGPQLGAALQSAEDYWVAADFTPTAGELLELIKGMDA